MALDPRKYHFIHIPKCAGTSIAHAGKQLGVKWGEFQSGLTESPWQHHTPMLFSKMSPPAQSFTFLRDPKERLVSEILWHKRKGKTLGINWNSFDITQPEDLTLAWFKLKRRLSFDIKAMSLLVFFARHLRLQWPFQLYSQKIRDRVLPEVGWGHFVPQFIYLITKPGVKGSISVLTEAAEFEQMFGVKLESFNVSNSEKELQLKQLLSEIITENDIKDLYNKDILLFQNEAKK